MQAFPVLYPVWPSPSRRSRTPESSGGARATDQANGVAGSRVVPMTTIGAAPLAWIVGTGWSLRGVNPRQEVRLQAKTLPKTGEAFSNAGNCDGTRVAGIDQGSSRHEMAKKASIELFWKVPSGLRAA